MMNTKKYLISAGVVAAILVGAVSLTIAATAMPMVLQVSSNGGILLRGTVSAVGANSLTVKSWGGDWMVNISTTTALLPEKSVSQFEVGDFVGVRGIVSQNASWTVDANLVRNWTPKIRNNKVTINGVSGPSALTVGQIGTWTINAIATNNGNLIYSVTWGDQVNYPMTANNYDAINYTQTATFTHSYTATGNYTPKFYVRDSAGNTASASMSVNVSSVNPASPTINYLQPNSGAIGTMVTIYGSGFTATGNKIRFGSMGSENNPAYSFNSFDGKTLTFTVPINAYVACLNATPPCLVATYLTPPGTYDVSVINANGTSNEVSFTVTAKSDVYSCLPSGVTSDTVVSIDIGGANKVTVGQKLNALGASCSNGQLVDSNNKIIKFYNLKGCWGNPPYNYQEILAQQNQDIQTLQAQYTVITLTCNSNGIIVQ